jgi:hypothetical protein
MSSAAPSLKNNYYSDIKKFNSENLPPPTNRGLNHSANAPLQERPGSPISHYTDRPPPSIWKQMKKFNQAFGPASYSNNSPPTMAMLEETGIFFNPTDTSASK